MITQGHGVLAGRRAVIAMEHVGVQVHAVRPGDGAGDVVPATVASVLVSWPGTASAHGPGGQGLTPVVESNVAVEGPIQINVTEDARLITTHITGHAGGTAEFKPSSRLRCVKRSWRANALLHHSRFWPLRAGGAIRQGLSRRWP
ncbi:MAG TPA: hypothetical protein VGV93_06830 [Acidimicrobiales bacterium]|nr:hypothetical protein [Acidimicrobiales bacterium]